MENGPSDAHVSFKGVLKDRGWLDNPTVLNRVYKSFSLDRNQALDLGFLQFIDREILRISVAYCLSRQSDLKGPLLLSGNVRL